jgi:hypothetical protein
VSDRGEYPPPRLTPRGPCVTFDRPVTGRTMRRLLGLALTVVVAAAACKTIREELPTQPGPSDPDDPLAGGPMIPAAPTPTPTPAPEEQSPLPAPPGSGGDGGGGGAGGSASCGDPVPPAISRVNVKVHSRQSSRDILDATPLVGPNATYCRQIGYTDGRSFCAVRPPGHPEREACEAQRVGSAADTGRLGPTWSANGAANTGLSPAAGARIRRAIESAPLGRG